MTQKIRWLAALALLLAFGACAVRAEEEDEVTPPGRPAPELLPPPAPATCPAGGGTCVRIVQPAVPALTWPIQFGVPAPLPCPCPAPFLPVGFAPYAQGYGCGSACPCPAGCPDCAYSACAASMPCDPMQYEVALKVCKAAADGGVEILTQPRIRALDMQPATVEIGCVHSDKEQSSCQIQLMLTKQGKGALMNVAVTESATAQRESGPHMHSETTEQRCHMAFGAATKLELSCNSDGSPKTWLEATVTPVEHEERVKTASAPEMEDADDSPLSDMAEVVQDLFDMVADTAAELFGADASPEQATLPAGLYVPQPPAYFPADAPVPMARELSSCQGSVRSCPTGGCSGCTQCVAAEAVHQAAMHVCIDGTGERKCVEMSSGKKHFKATADHLTVHDGCVELEGNVQAESCDDSCNDCMVIKADKIRVERKDGGMKISIDGPGAPTSVAPSYYDFQYFGR